MMAETWSAVNSMTQLQMEVMSNGTVTIPPELYASMGWQRGEKLIVQVEDGKSRFFCRRRRSHEHRHGWQVLCRRVDRCRMS